MEQPALIWRSRLSNLHITLWCIIHGLATNIHDTRASGTTKPDRETGLFCDDLGTVSIRKTVLPGMAIPMLKIRRPNDRLNFNMEIAIRR